MLSLDKWEASQFDPIHVNAMAADPALGDDPGTQVGGKDDQP